MFTGIIQAVGHIETLERMGDDVRVQIHTGTLDLAGATVGDSIAVNGVCLTAISLGDSGFEADVSGETLSRTTFADAAPGWPANLERALTPATPLGGHMVSGHVDGIGVVGTRQDDGRSVRFTVRAPDRLARYIAEKGSVCVDGVSLTVNAVDGANFELNIVPHTLEATTMGGFQPGRRVNLEVDLIARYLERLMLGDRAAEPGAPGA